MKGLLLFMNSRSLRFPKIGILLTLLIQAVALSSFTGCKKPEAAEPVKESVTSPAAPKDQKAPEPKQAAKTVPAAATATTNAPLKVLVFRNTPSWNRKPDFEDVLTDLGMSFDVKTSSDMESTDLAPFSFVIIPGAQWRDDFYLQYAENAARFEGYVTNGGILVLELNGAEGDGITLPRNISMVKHGAVDNLITSPTHPILTPLAGKSIHANFASHGYLKGVPKDALILTTEMLQDQPAMDKPTFVEYSHGAGRVIAACQCFHDRDGSGRGPLMQTVISYAADRQWFTPPKK